MSCDQYEHLIQGYVDQNLTTEEKKQLNAHITECNQCHRDLQDMIEVVAFIEDMSALHTVQSKKRGSRLRTTIISTCVAVCSAMVFTLYYPFESNMDEVITNFEYQNFVLADESESLPMPSSENVIVLLPRNKNNSKKRSSRFDEDSLEITWIYPSAYTHLPDFEWDTDSEQLVLLEIPNQQVLTNVLSLLNKGKLHHLIENNYKYPVSVVINNKNSGLEIQPIQFNLQENGIDPLFDQLTKVSFQVSH